LSDNWYSALLGGALFWFTLNEHKRHGYKHEEDELFHNDGVCEFVNKGKENRNIGRNIYFCELNLRPNSLLFFLPPRCLATSLPRLLL
jgi:hypothetical protein